MDAAEQFERLRVMTQLKKLPSSKLKQILADPRPFKYKTLWQDEDAKRKAQDYRITDKWEKLTGY